MNSDDEDFERQMLEYSEIETIPKDQFEAILPRTIQQYQQRIQSNNSASIFDADYTLDRPSDNCASESPKATNKNFDKDQGVFNNDKVTYIISGRGRGGRNIVINPGEPNRNQVLNGDEEVRLQIRKVAPMGYSNQITESAVRAHKMSKVLEQDPNATPAVSKSNSPAISKPNSPAISKPSSPAVLKATSKANSTSPPSSRMNIESPVVSGKSTPCSIASDIHSSDYFTSQDNNDSSSSSKANQKEEESKGESSEAPGASTNQIQPSSVVNTGAVAKRPVPLSVMLRESRKAHKKKQIDQDTGFTNGFSRENYENEMASRRTIVELLQQDRLEQDMKSKLIPDVSSSSSMSSRDEVLPWRQRNNSPPRYSWGQLDRTRSKQLDINSFEDFPSLK